MARSASRTKYTLRFSRWFSTFLSVSGWDLTPIISRQSGGGTDLRWSVNLQFFTPRGECFAPLDKPVVQRLLYSAVGAVNTISRVRATRHESEKSHDFIFENVIFHMSNLHARSLYLNKPVLQERVYSAVGSFDTAVGNFWNLHFSTSPNDYYI